MEKILPKKSDVAGFRLITGEELIGKIKKVTGGYEVTHAHQIMNLRDPATGQLVADMLPHSLIAPATVFFKDEFLASDPYELPAEMESIFIEQTTGIRLQLA